MDGWTDGGWMDGCKNAWTQNEENNKQVNGQAWMTAGNGLMPKVNH